MAIVHRFSLFLLCAMSASAIHGAARAHVVQCDVALVLVADVSGSIMEEDYDIQMQGTAAAFRSDQIASAILTKIVREMS